MNVVANIFVVANLLITLTTGIRLEDFEKDKKVFSNKYIAKGVRGYLKVILRIIEISNLKPNVNSILYHNEANTLDTDQLVSICLASNQTKNGWKLKDCKIAKLTENEPPVKHYEEVRLPLTKQNENGHVVVTYTAASSENIAYSFPLPNKLYNDNITHSVIGSSSEGHKFEQALATLSLRCSPNFFGLHCQHECDFPSVRHTCDPLTGQLKCAKGWFGKNCDVKVFITRQKASQFIRNLSKRSNSNFLEELRQGNIERECLEETCSKEEAREAFEDDALTEAFWRAYTDPDYCEPNPCVSRNTERCEDLLGNYTCHCFPGYIGRNCEQEIGVCHSQPCLNEGRCESTGPNTYTCECPVGYRGRICSINIDDCMQSNCGLHGDCVDGVNFFNCRCDDGYAGSQCDVNINECASNPCHNGGNCTDHVNFYSCQCPRNFQGNNCEQEADPCGENPCLHGGRCKVAPDLTVKCVCPTDYTGKLCQHPIQSICAGTPCANGGTCYETKNNITDELNPNYPNVPREFGCACALGFTGHVCQERVGPCSLHEELCPYNATCISLDNQFICVCPTGYTGDACQYRGSENVALDKLRCTDNSCFNDARCLNYRNKTTCICRPGFQGLRCEFEANHCSSNPCKNNGDCILVSNGFFCNCPQGFRGKHCQEDINECALENAICRNRATCVNSVGSFQCLCGPYYTGIFCEQDFDQCDSDPCMNGGTCDRETTGYICDCLQGFGGKNCEIIIDPCTEATNPCFNDANCTSNPEVPYEAICSCPHGFYGRFCVTQTDNCAVKSNLTAIVNGEVIHQLEARKDCGNNGYCVSVENGFICSCHRGYEGERCEKPFKLPIVNCTTENCHCPAKLVEEVQIKTKNNSKLQCQYQQYTEGVCKPAICLTSICREHTEIYECAWISDCLTAYITANAEERLGNSSYSCPVLEVVLNRKLLQDDTTVEHFCNDIRNLPSYERFSDAALVHCSLLQLNEENCSLAVSVDSTTSQKQAILLASDVFQTLEQELAKAGTENDFSLDPTFSAIMELRYAGSTGHFSQTAGRTFAMTSPTPPSVSTDVVSTYHYIIVVVVFTSVIVGCSIAGYTYFYRKRRKNDPLVSYNVNANITTADQSNENIPSSTPASAAAKQRKSNKSQVNHGFVNPGFVAQQACNARCNVESNPYVTMPYATMEITPRTLSTSEEIKRNVEESTVDYEVLKKFPKAIESNHYELMASSSSFSDVNKGANVNDNIHAYAFALKNHGKVNQENEKVCVKQNLNDSFFDEYEEVGEKQETAVEYENLQSLSSSVDTNMNSQASKNNSMDLIDDAPYNFATEIPSIGIPSLHPCSRGAATKTKTNKHHVYANSRLQPR